MSEVDHSEKHTAIEEDGWTMIHNAIRLDLEDTRIVLERMQNAKAAPDFKQSDVAHEYDALAIWWEAARQNSLLRRTHADTRS